MSCVHWAIPRGDDLYPAPFEELHTPPQTVYGMGDPTVLSTPCISIIGARRATPYGLSIAQMGARVSAECGITVVSGGAMGCDAAAARAALLAGGKTIVVSGCGADVVYPSTSQDVYEQAVQRGGAVISVERWGQGPRKYAFRKRNTLIAALGKSLIVTEAGIGSGTMSTADAAVELGRAVYAIPGSIFSPNSSGTNGLLAEGARVIPDEKSLESAISLDYGVMRFSQALERKDHGPVLSALTASPMSPDELARALNEEVLTTLRTLSDYEIRGLVTRLPDGRYSPSESFLMSGG